MHLIAPILESETILANLMLRVIAHNLALAPLVQSLYVSFASKYIPVFYNGYYPLFYLMFMKITATKLNFIKLHYTFRQLIETKLSEFCIFENHNQPQSLFKPNFYHLSSGQHAKSLPTHCQKIIQ